MTGRRPWWLAVALLVVYGMVVPSAATSSVSAHLTGWHLVRGGHLNYFNRNSASLPGGDFSDLIRLAENEWQPRVGIAITEVFSAQDADVIISSKCQPQNDALAVTYPANHAENPRRINN